MGYHNYDATAKTAHRISLGTNLGAIGLRAILLNTYLAYPFQTKT